MTLSTLKCHFYKKDFKTLDFIKLIMYNSIAQRYLYRIYRDVAQFGRAPRSGYRTERFDQNLPNRDNPLKYATLSPSQYS